MTRSRSGINCRLVLWICVFIFTLAACEKEDYKPVDFSKTVSVSTPTREPRNEKPLRVAVAAMTSPRENFSSYRKLLDYMGKKLETPIQLVQRKTYAEINSLFAKGGLDLAFICTGPYVTGADRVGFEGLVVPVISGAPFYQAYLIVNRDSEYNTLDDLKGKTFAFTDSDSNTGAAVPQYWLSLINETPETFFKEIVYTYSHDNSIKAVARSLVDGASVDSTIWEFYAKKDPTYTAQTRIIKKSEPFGSPPLVAAKSLPASLKKRIKTILLEMDTDPEGTKILSSLGIDEFDEMKNSCYASTRKMFETLNRLREDNREKK